MAMTPSEQAQQLPRKGLIIKTSTARIRRTTAAVIVWALAMAIVGLSGRAQAAPASTAPYASNAPGVNITINVTVVNIGGTVNLTLVGAVAGHDINFYIHSKEVYLATHRANSHGVVSAALTIPSSFTGHHTIVARDPLNGQSWSTSLTIASSGAASSTSGSGSGTNGGLPNTGAAVLGLGVLALILVFGGATLLLMGRRRVRSAH
jgi:hypothetical protein